MAACVGENTNRALSGGWWLLNFAQSVSHIRSGVPSCLVIGHPFDMAIDRSFFLRNLGYGMASILLVLDTSLNNPIWDKIW